MAIRTSVSRKKKIFASSRKKKPSELVNSNTDKSRMDVRARIEASMSEYDSLRPDNQPARDNVIHGDASSWETPITLVRPPEAMTDSDVRAGQTIGSKSGSVNGLGSPKKLNFDNLRKHRKGLTDGVKDGWKPQPPTINDRLRQAKNFLSDEDAIVHMEFASRLEKIDQFLQRVMNEKMGCDVKLYDEVQAMVETHRSRMNRQKIQNIERPQSNLAPWQSQRLSLVDTSKRGLLRGAPLRDDHPPFTLERPADQNLFIEALHGQPESTDPKAQDRTLKLLGIEGDAFLETLEDPSLVHEWVEERQSQTRDARFEARAMKRGRRRAAIRMALRSFATNCEQHHEGGWDHRVLQLPSAPPPKLPERGIMSVGNEKVERSSETPFPWTRKYLRFLRLRKARPETKNDISLQELARPLNGNQPIATEKQALNLLRAEILKENRENKKPLNAQNDPGWPTERAKSGKTEPYFSLSRWSGQNGDSVGEDRQNKLKGSSKKQKPTQSVRGTGQNSQDQRAPDIGTGALIPQEMKEFDYRRDKHLLANARDPKETVYDGAQSAFMFAETPFLQALASKQIERDLASDIDDGREDELIIHLESAKFPLPEAQPIQKAAPFDPEAGRIRYLRRHILRRNRLEKERAERQKSNDEIKTPKQSPSKVQGRTPAKVQRKPQIDHSDFAQKIYQGWAFNKETGELIAPKRKKGENNKDGDTEKEEVVEVTTGGNGRIR